MENEFDEGLDGNTGEDGGQREDGEREQETEPHYTLWDLDEVDEVPLTVEDIMGCEVL